MRWLITGANGQLGSDLAAVLSHRASAPAATVGKADRADTAGIVGRADMVAAFGRAELDITDAVAVAAVVAEQRPEVIVNAAAYTAVDAAESDEQTAYRVNALGPANLAAAAESVGARLIQVSTDYVFAGDASTPYEVDAPTAPASAYGRTKLAGEQLVQRAAPKSYIVRTAWVYGATGGNFVKTMARLERDRPTIDVVDDQRGSPTWSADLARGLVALASSGAQPGVYHCTNAGDTTWRGLAQAVFSELGADPGRVRATSSAAFTRPAPRPAYSVLSSRAWAAAGLPLLPDWPAALHQAFVCSPDALRP